MEYHVPELSIVFMGVSALAAIAIPVLLLLFIRKKYRADIAPFFVGCAVFLIFALILEGIVHSVFLKSPVGLKMQQNIWLYGAYGGLMAGLFEEVGRFVAFKTVLRKKLGRDANALMYGAGHGGFEVLFILGLSMISNLATAAMLNAGMTDALTAGVTDGAALAQMEAAFSELAYTPSATFLVGIVERIAAVALHLSFSVLVWFAAKEQKAFWLFPLALLLHALVDFGTVVLSKFVANVWIIEAAIYAMTAFCVLIALYVWKKHARPGEPEPRREPDGDAPQEA